jgi:hypothetical protein
LLMTNEAGAENSPKVHALHLLIGRRWESVDTTLYISSSYRLFSARHGD